MTGANPSFTGIRSFFWPIHRIELKKLIPLLLLIFFISFNYQILRNLKDALVVTAKNSGAEAIPFIKVWVMFPFALLITYFFTKLSNYLSREKVFYVMVGIFISFFLLFTFVIYPYREVLHPHQLASHLRTILPTGFKGFIAMIEYWSFTGFYAMAELWGTAILQVLFWSFANEVVSVQEAKRFYPLLGIGANLSGVAAGPIAIILSQGHFNLRWIFSGDPWGQSLFFITIVLLVNVIAIVFIFRWINYRTVDAHKKELLTQHPQKITLGTKPHMSFRKTIRYLFQSRYLLMLALIVLTYNVVINLVEVVWKHEIKELYPNSNDFNAYMGGVTLITGILATIIAIFFSGNLLRRFSWTKIASITPLILLFTSIGFFFFLFVHYQFEWAFSKVAGFSSLAIVVFFGSMQNCLSRASKYTIFDATKEIAFIPLDSESKLKGKAAIDGVGSRLGKSGGSITYQAMLLFCGSLAASLPFVGIILFSSIGIWLYAVSSLGKEFHLLTDPHSPEKEPSKSEAVQKGLPASQLSI